MAGHCFYLYGPRDLQVNLEDRDDGRYCVKIGDFDGMGIVGTLNELAQVFTMGGTLIEIEEMRLRKDAAKEDFAQEKARAEGE